MSESYFTNRIFYRFFFPSIISSLCLAVANLADALCVGMMLGEPALAAISLVSPIYMVFNVLDLGIAVGGAVTFTKLLGEGRAKRAVEIFSQMLLCALVLSVTIAVLGVVFLEQLLGVLGTYPAQGQVYTMTCDYALRLLIATPLFFLNLLFYHFVRCDDGERRASVGLAVANLLDVGLSFVLVLGLGLGVRGAIYSTIIGTATGILIYLPHFFSRSNLLSLRLPRKPDPRLMFQCYRTGFSTSSQYIFQFILFLVLNNLLIRLHGESGLAVFNVVLNISYVCMGLYDGVGATIQPLAATFCGERNRSAQRHTLKLALIWGTGLGVVMAGAGALLAPWIAGVFGLSPEMLPMGVLALRCYCLGVPLAGFSVMLGAYWQAENREDRTMVLTSLRSFVIYLAFAVPLSMGPLERFWWMFPGIEAVSLGAIWLYCTLQSLRRGPAFQGLEEQPIYHYLLREDLEELSHLLEEVEAFCDQQGASMQQTYFVTMTVEEMCQAIFEHSEQAGAMDTYIQITLFQSAPALFELHIRDNASAFDPFSLRTSRISDAENEESALDSIGVLMVKKKAKEFYYRHYQGFNTLTVRI